MAIKTVFFVGVNIIIIHGHGTECAAAVPFDVKRVCLLTPLLLNVCVCV